MDPSRPPPVGFDAAGRVRLLDAAVAAATTGTAAAALAFTGGLASLHAQAAAAVGAFGARAREVDALRLRALSQRHAVALEAARRARAREALRALLGQRRAELAQLRAELAAEELAQAVQQDAVRAALSAAPGRPWQ
jgi:hypothetical protein